MLSPEQQQPGFNPPSCAQNTFTALKKHSLLTRYTHYYHLDYCHTTTPTSAQLNYALRRKQSFKIIQLSAVKGCKYYSNSQSMKANAKLTSLTSWVLRMSDKTWRIFLGMPMAFEKVTICDTSLQWMTSSYEKTQKAFMSNAHAMSRSGEQKSSADKSWKHTALKKCHVKVQTYMHIIYMLLK